MTPEEREVQSYIDRRNTELATIKGAAENDSKFALFADDELLKVMNLVHGNPNPQQFTRPSAQETSAQLFELRAPRFEIATRPADSNVPATLRRSDAQSQLQLWFIHSFFTHPRILPTFE